MFARKAPEELLEEIKHIFMNPKFVEITQDQVNKLEFTLDLGHDFDQIMDLHEKQGYTLLLAVCKLLSFELEASFHPDLPTMAKDFIMNGLRFRHLPADLIMTAINTLKGLDLNFQFYSTDQLPEKAKKIIGSDWDKVLEQVMSIFSEDDKNLISKLCASLNNLEYISTQFGLTLHTKHRAPGFSTWVKKFTT